jgi:hypothetical protein
MAHGVRHHGRQDARVDHHHGAGDARHAARHDDEKLPAAHVPEVGADEERRLDHAHEDVGGRREAHRSAHAHGFFQHRGKSADEQRQHAPVEKQRRQRAHHQYQRQRAKRQHEARRSRARLEGLLPAAEKAEDEPRALLGRRLQREQRVVQLEEERLEDGRLEQQGGERQLEQRAGNHGAPRKGAALLREEPGYRNEGEESEGALQGEQDRLPPAPGRALCRVFQHDTRVEQLFPDAVGFCEVLRLARCRPISDQLLHTLCQPCRNDFRIDVVAHGDCLRDAALELPSPLQKSVRVTLKQPQNPPQGLQ